MKIKKLLKKIINVKTRNIDEVREISYEDLKYFINNNIDVQIVDIRSPKEYAEKRIKSAINIPLYDLNKEDTLMLPDKNKLIVLYCACGVRSKKAYKILEEEGYTNLYSLKDGLEGI